MIVSWQIKHYSELSVSEFHDLIALRIAVFVVEQDCPYQELDGKDKMAYHLIGKNGEGDIVATARILPPGVSYTEVSIGRVVSSPEVRKSGLGRQLIAEAHKFIHDEFGLNTPIRLFAQTHLKGYYELFGYVETSKNYLEDGIPHTEMLKSNEML